MARNDLFHDFYYQNNWGEVRQPKSYNIGYNGRKFYSYYTVIGYAYTPKKGGDIMFLSMNGMSTSTRKHLYQLKSACPFKVLYVPFEYGDNFEYIPEDMILNTLAERFIKYLEEYKGVGFTRKKDREDFETLLYRAQDFDKYVCRVKGLRKYLNLWKKVNTLEYQNMAKEKIAKQAKAKAKKTLALKKKLSRNLKGSGFLDIARQAYDYRTRSGKTGKDFRKYLEGTYACEETYKKPSFVWVQEDMVKTSQGVIMPIDSVKVLLRAWKLGKNIVGKQLDRYTIIANNENWVKVGCHIIPTDNIRALAKVLL